MVLKLKWIHVHAHTFLHSTFENLACDDVKNNMFKLKWWLNGLKFIQVEQNTKMFLFPSEISRLILGKHRNQKNFRKTLI